jgi:ribonuclease E
MRTERFYKVSKKMLINASHPEENRVAIVVDGILSELDIEIAGQEQSKGNIYKAVVIRIETGLQAAFVDYGAEKLGFLQIGDIHPNIYPPNNDSKSYPRIADILHRGQEILVQIVKEERGNKGVALTTFLSLPGRYMVLMPDSTTKGVSRKINEDSERKKLKKTMAELELPEQMGYIVRTAGIGKDKDELKRDFDYLVRLYESIVARKDQIKAPAQLYQESNLAIRSIRDYFSTEIDEVLVDDQQVFQDTKDFFALVMPELSHLVKRHRERRPIFSRYQIEKQIDDLVNNQTALPSGGSIVIDQTEALVAIDVNSGKMSSENGIEATAHKTNLEAATEIGRQLRLRDLGGLVVIDFIDMRNRKNIHEIEQESRKALKDDKAKVSVGRISQFGLLEMSRQRIKPVLSVGAYIECPHCKGIGRIKSVEAQAVAFLRQAHTAASKGLIGHIEAGVPLEVANYLLNQKRTTINELERQLNLKISILGRVELLPGDLELELHKREKEQDNSSQILPVSHANQIEIALAAAQQEEHEAPEQQDKESNESASEQIKTNEAAEKNKKRRRRRHKKPVSHNLETEEENQQEQGIAISVENTQTERTEQLVTEIVTSGQQIKQKPDETPSPETEISTEEKPKHRPRIKMTAETVSETATETIKTLAEEKPQRKPRRTTKKVAEESPDKTETPPSTEKSENEKPKRRTRKTVKKTEEKTPEKVVATSAPETVAEEKPQRKPRRTTKKVAEESPDKTETPPSTEKSENEKPQQPPHRTSIKKTAPET